MTDSQLKRKENWNKQNCNSIKHVTELFAQVSNPEGVGIQILTKQITVVIHSFKRKMHCPERTSLTTVRACKLELQPVCAQSMQHLYPR